jgi:hypothetical protein
MHFESQEMVSSVIPAKAGIQEKDAVLDPGWSSSASGGPG